jgi:hypothetical protein
VTLLEPCGRLGRPPFGLYEVIDVLAKGWIGQYALELLPRNRLQDNTGVMGQFP